MVSPHSGLRGRCCATAAAAALRAAAQQPRRPARRAAPADTAALDDRRAATVSRRLRTLAGKLETTKGFRFSNNTEMSGLRGHLNRPRPQAAAGQGQARALKTGRRKRFESERLVVMSICGATNCTSLCTATKRPPPPHLLQRILLRALLRRLLLGLSAIRATCARIRRIGREPLGRHPQQGASVCARDGI